MHWFWFWTGLIPNTRPNLAWGGILSAGLISGGLITGIIQRYRQTICHNRGCYRIAHHVTAEGYRLCKKCVAKPITELVLHEIHEDHRTKGAMK